MANKKKRKIPIWAILKEPTYLLIGLGFAFIFFDISFYLMLTLIGSDGYSCIPAGNLTISNVIFSIILSCLTGLTISGIIKLAKQRHLEQSTTGGLFSLIGLLVGTFTIFCTTCSFPILFGLGFSSVIHLFTEFNWYFKIISLGLIGLSLYQLNKQLTTQ